MSVLPEVWSASAGPSKTTALAECLELCLQQSMQSEPKRNIKCRFRLAKVLAEQSACKQDRLLPGRAAAGGWRSVAKHVILGAGNQPAAAQRHTNVTDRLTLEMCAAAKCMGPRAAPWRALSGSGAVHRLQPTRTALHIVAQAANAPAMVTLEQVSLRQASGRVGRLAAAAGLLVGF